MAYPSNGCTEQEAKTPNRQLSDTSGTVWPHIAVLISQIIALNVPNFHGRRTFFAFVIAGLAILAQFNRFTNDLGTANLFALAWPHYLSTIEKLLFSGPGGPEQALWRLDKHPKEAQQFVPFGLEKLKWSIMLLLNLRGVDWSFQIKNIPVLGSRYRSRPIFLFAQTIEFMATVTMADLVAQATIKIIFTPPTGLVGSLNSKCITLRDSDLSWSFVKALIYGSGPYFFINMQYVFCSIIAVGLGLSAPKDWPPLFGKIAKVTTVRKFWGSFWQQMMRRFFTTYSRKFVEVLGIRRGTNWSSYTQLYFTFFISGIFHSASLLLMPYPTNITFRQRTIGIMYYFLWQAVAITLEDMVQWAWRSVFGKVKANNRLANITGYVWVICSFWFSLPWAGDVMMRIKMGETSPFPFAITGRLMKYIPTR